MNEYIYATKSRKASQSATFKCSFDTQLGAYSISEGEPLKACSRTAGDFYLYVSWASDPIGIYTAAQINQLAGYQAVL